MMNRSDNSNRSFNDLMNDWICQSEVSNVCEAFANRANELFLAMYTYHPERFAEEFPATFEKLELERLENEVAFQNAHENGLMIA